jgi:hypothetical protein
VKKQETIQIQELDKQEEDGNVKFLVQPLFTPSFILFKKINLNHLKILNELKNLSFNSTNNENDENNSEISNSIKVLEEISEGNEIKKVFKNCFDFGIRSIWRYNIDHQIINSWATRAFPKTKNEYHNHKNFWLSAVYYPCNERNFKIKFLSDRKDLGSFEIPVYDNNIYNGRSWEYTVEQGDLILFNASLYHKIVKNITPTVRYSLAMNILPKGKIGFKDGTLVL